MCDRELTLHKVEGLNDKLKVMAGPPGAGGAPHSYYITPTIGNAKGLHIEFQSGPMGPDTPPNGVTNEVLLAIVIDRLQNFQAGPFACEENKTALTMIEEGLAWLQNRTKKRLARGVEGKLEA